MPACYNCNEECETYRCEACNAIQAQKQRDDYEPRPSVKRCKTCGAGGHYAKTCGKRDPLRIKGPYAKQGAAARTCVELGGWEGFCALWSYVTIARRANVSNPGHAPRVTLSGGGI